jgi:hypothetical protein
MFYEFKTKIKDMGLIRNSWPYLTRLSVDNINLYLLKHIFPVLDTGFV